MNIPTNAEAIDPTAPIKTVKKNIIWISLVSLTCTKIILDLNSAGNSILIPPFDLLPTKSIFTFWFSFIFIHHETSFFFVLLGSLFLLLCRSFFDYFYHERHSPLLTNNAQTSFSILVYLKNVLVNSLKEPGIAPHKITLLLKPIYRPQKALGHSLDLDSTGWSLLSIASTYLSDTRRANTLIELSKEQPFDIYDLAHLTGSDRKDIIDAIWAITIELMKLQKKACEEFYSSWVHRITCIASPIFGSVTFIYCIYKLLQLRFAF